MLRAFEAGVDGVYLVGCEEGNCHFLSGNLRARKRVERVQTILESLGIEGDRIKMYNLSAGEGVRFVEAAIESTERIKKLGPSPLRLKDDKIDEACLRKVI